MKAVDLQQGAVDGHQCVSGTLDRHEDPGFTKNFSRRHGADADTRAAGLAKGKIHLSLDQGINRQAVVSLREKFFTGRQSKQVGEPQHAGEFPVGEVGKNKYFADQRQEGCQISGNGHWMNSLGDEALGLGDRLTQRRPFPGLRPSRGPGQP